MAANLPLSIVVATRDSAATLDRALSAILASELPRATYELIVVDDASIDASAIVAARYADTVVRLSGSPTGPGYARNRGAEVSSGDIVAFVDPDVLVLPDTLPRMLRTLAAHPRLDAISASRNATSAAANLVSRYWNLLISFGEQRQLNRAVHLVSDCTAIRRNALVSAGMYDEWRFLSGGLEGIDLGIRLLKKGAGVMLSHDLQITHLKCWTLGALLREAWCRSVLLARSLGYQRTRTAAPSEVVVTLSEPMSPPLAVVGTVALTSAFVADPYWLTIGAVAAGVAILINLPIYTFFARARSVAFAVAATPLHLLVQSIVGVGLCTGWVLRDVFGAPPQDATTQAYAEVGVEIWPPIRRQS